MNRTLRHFKHQHHNYAGSRRARQENPTPPAGGAFSSDYSPLAVEFLVSIMRRCSISN
jgi:Ni/Fe-hydrogenase subunit HybB-like protein